jgi:large subunit ribosomal protein L9
VEVILLEEVTGLGSRGATVKVSAGYARNFLLPRKLAIAAAGNPTNLFRTLSRQRETRDAKLRQEAEVFAARLQGALFGSVSQADVSEGLGKLGFEVDRKQVHLEEHIKSLGVHEVGIRLHGGVTTTVTVEVIPQ